MLHSVSAGYCEALNGRASDEDGSRAECQGFHDVGATANPSVEVHLDRFAHLVLHSWQHVDCRGNGVELPATVIRDNDPVGTVLDSQPGVRWMMNALEDDGE